MFIYSFNFSRLFLHLSFHSHIYSFTYSLIILFIIRAVDNEESINLLTVGATRTIPDERESSITMATVLLRDVLKVENTRLNEMIVDLRLRVEEDERNEFEVISRKNGLKSSTDRVSNDDDMSSMPSSLR